MFHFESLSKTHPETTSSRFLKVLMACISTASMELIAADPGQKDSASIGTSTEVIRRVMIITPGLFQDNQKITESEENTFFID